MPQGLLIGVFLVTGMGGATSLLAFDVARRPMRRTEAAARQGFVNLGGFGFAVAADCMIGATLDRAHAVGMGGLAAFRLAFLPFAALFVVGLVSVARGGRGFTKWGR